MNEFSRFGMTAVKRKDAVIFFLKIKSKNPNHKKKQNKKNNHALELSCCDEGKGRSASVQ